MLITKGHYERTTAQNLPDPFKKHLIHFETEKYRMANNSLIRLQLKTEKMKLNCDEYLKKKSLV